MMLLALAIVLITIAKSMFSLKTAGILAGMKLVILADLLGLDRAGLLSQWLLHWG